jgi:uncharacterized protein DUF3467
MADEKPAQLQIEIDEATARGAYANLALITHSETEFVLDFMFLQPQTPKTRVISRVVTSPVHAKRLLAALQDNVRKYESRFGEIKAEPQPAGAAPGRYFH